MSKQRVSFVFLAGTVCKDGGSSGEVYGIGLTGAVVWKKVEGIMWDRKVEETAKWRSVGGRCRTSLCI